MCDSEIGFDELSGEVDELLERLDSQPIGSQFDRSLLRRFPEPTMKMPYDYGPGVGDELFDYEEW